ncbi:hypothetical protein [Haloarchaeobius sp. DYHT-AS-18]|uniref:hypothetical protein n=1 Tax=Haloarchaeobius sp. DYHT-AS-18 TaxID=3446117 RepID=UPI003EBF58B8
MKLVPALKWTGQVLGVELLLAFFIFEPSVWEHNQFAFEKLVVFMVFSILAAGLLLLRTVDNSLANR